MRELENLKELYLDEIRKINKKGELNPADGESAKKALEALEKINELCCEENKDIGMKGYSEGMVMPRYYSRNMMPEMYNGYGYSGYRGQPRDSMGRYTRDDATEHMIHSLEDMMQSAPTERHREVISDCIHKLRNY